MTPLENKFSKILQRQVPEPAIDYCLYLWKEHPFNFKIKKNRTSKLGDYRYQPKDKSHTITVNGDLNRYAFLVTYLHEVAHLITFKTYGRKVRPHGPEWKASFKKLSLPVLNDQVFPAGVLRSLAGYLKNPKASSCTDHNLLKALAMYDNTPVTFLSEIKVGEQFYLGKRIFKKENLRRTRYVCQEVTTGKKYLISKSAQVETA